VTSNPASTKPITSGAPNPGKLDWVSGVVIAVALGDGVVKACVAVGASGVLVLVGVTLGWRVTGTGVEVAGGVTRSSNC